MTCGRAIRQEEESRVSVHKNVTASSARLDGGGQTGAGRLCRCDKRPTLGARTAECRGEVGHTECHLINPQGLQKVHTVMLPVL